MQYSFTVYMYRVSEWNGKRKDSHMHDNYILEKHSDATNADINTSRHSLPD